MLKFSKVFDKNYKAFKDKLRYIINQGGTSSTKTFSILQLLVAICLKYNVKIDIVGLSVPHLKSGVLNDMPFVCEQFGINFSEHYKETDKQFICGKGKINFLAFDKLGKAHGGRRDILYMNEANHLNYNIVEQLMVRTRQSVFIDYNPTNEFWVHTKLLVEEPEKCELIRSTYKDNPFLEQTIIDMIESKKGNNNFWRVYGLGELGVAEGLVYDNFEVLDFDKNKFAKYYNGIDWGFSNDPFAFVRVAVEQDCLYICNEIYQRKLLNKDSAPLVKDIIGSEYVYCDSAEPKSIAEYQNLGVNALACQKGAGSIESGVKHIQSYKKVYIHPSCPNVLTEFRSYEWKQDKNGEYMPIPVDAFNHCLVGDTLVTTKKGDIPIKDVKVGDYVLTRKGFKKVLWSGISAKNVQTYIIKTKNGKTLTGTYNHKIFANNCFRDIIALRYGDKLLTLKENAKWLNEKQSSMTAKYGIDIRMQREVATETITKKQENFYITMFGKNITANVKKAIIYIILTVIMAIMLLKTWKKLPLKSIWQNVINLHKNSCKNVKNGVKKSDHSQKSGTLPMRVKSGILNTLKEITLDIYTMEQANAKCVEKNLKKIQKIKDFVQIVASQNTEECRDLITFQKFVKYVEKNLLQINTVMQDTVQDNVLTVQCGKIEKQVYDLTVEDCHEFFANGILVHNCLDAIRYALNDVIGQNSISAIKGLRL